MQGGFGVLLSSMGGKVGNRFAAFLSLSYSPGGPQLKPEDHWVGG